MSFYFKFYCDQCEKINGICVFRMSNGNEFIFEECYNYYFEEDFRYILSIIIILKDCFENYKKYVLG